MQHGFYDLLLTQALEKQCAELEGVQFSEDSMGKEEFWHEFPSLVAAEILNYLKMWRGQAQPLPSRQIKRKSSSTMITLGCCAARVSMTLLIYA